MDTEESWYLASNDAKHVRQVVLHLPAESRVPSRVEGCLVGKMATSSWAAITLFMPGDTPDRRGPFVFAKANGVVESLEGCPATVAFSFYRYRAGGLLQIFLHVKSPVVEQQAGSPYIVENGHWPEADDTRELIPELIAREYLDVCFLADGPSGPCQGYFGLRLALSQEIRVALSREWNALDEYHSSVRKAQRNQQEAMRQFESENPMSMNPILDSQPPPALGTPVAAHDERSKGTPRRTWWKFWK